MNAVAERMVLGAMMLHHDTVTECAEMLTGVDFHELRNELIFDAIAALSTSGQPADTTTVADQLAGDLERAGGRAYLFELTGSVVTASSGPYYAEMVRKASVTRRVRIIGARLADLPEQDDAFDLVEAARAELDKLAIRESGESTRENDLYDAIEDLERPPGTATPWRDLNDVIAGWKPGAFYVIGARPGVGKSVIANAALLDMARRGSPAIMFNLEMSKSEVYHRLLSSVGSVDMGRIQHRTLGKPDHEKIAKAAAHIALLPLIVDDRGAIKVAQIRSKVRTMQRKGNVGLVIVDYLQLMTGSSKRSENRQQEVSDMSRAMKLLAKEMQIPVVALSQLKRTATASPDRRPQMDDLRESGSLEQDADVVLLLHRDAERAPDVLEMLVAKNRHGPADRSIRLSWEGCYSRASDYLSTEFERSAS
jgi:replicative DNA helicase